MHAIARYKHDGVESSIDLGRLMARLTAKAQHAIQHVKLEGLSVAEAARRSGMTESTVKINIHRGLKAISAAIKRAVHARRRHPRTPAVRW